jgi:hypothetical protein
MRGEKELIQEVIAMIERHNSKPYYEKPPCIIFGKSWEATIYNLNTEIRIYANYAVTIGTGFLWR